MRRTWYVETVSGKLTLARACEAVATARAAAGRPVRAFDYARRDGRGGIVVRYR